MTKHEAGMTTSLRQTLGERRRALGLKEKLAIAVDGWLGRILRVPTEIIARNAQLSVDHYYTQMLAMGFDYLKFEEIEGDYAEFGVHQGSTFIEAHRVARHWPGYPRRFVAFDSFEGLPEPTGVDLGSRWAAGQFAASRDAFEQRLQRARVPADDVVIVEGWFNDTLTKPEQIPLEKVAFAWVDCDLYESTVPVLEYLTDRLVPGAVLAFDDWFMFRGARDKGESLACSEWLERNPAISLVPWRTFHWGGQAFLVQRKD